MVDLSPLVYLIYFIFLKIYQNKTSANTSNTVNLETYFILQAILEKYFLVYAFMSLHFLRSLNGLQPE